MDAAVAGFMKDGVDAAQLARIKQQVRAVLIYARDHADSLTNRYGSALAIGLSGSMTGKTARMCIRGR